MAASLQAHRRVSQQLRRGARGSTSYPDLRSGAEEEISKSLCRFLKTGFEILGSNFIAEASKANQARKGGADFQIILAPRKAALNLARSADLSVANLSQAFCSPNLAR